MLKAIAKYTTIAMLVSLVPISARGGPFKGNNKPNFTPPKILSPYGQIDIDAALVKDYMKFKASPLNEIVHIRVSCTKKIGQDSAHPYEELWYQSNQPIGSERKGELDLLSDHPVGIIVKLNAQSPRAEVKAAANAAVRLFMDISLKRALVSSVSVCDECFLQFVEDLAQDHFVRFRGSVAKSGIMLTVCSQSGRVEYLEFQSDS